MSIHSGFVDGKMPPVHPAAALFPMLGEAELRALAEDILQHGQQQPIVMFQGAILDGRNRWAACKLAGIEPQTIPWIGGDPVAYVIGANLHRRHLDESQRAMVAGRLATLRRGSNQHTAIAGCSEARAAELLSVSPDSVSRARAVLREGAPELVTAVEKGSVAVSTASAVAALPRERQRELVAAADPKVILDAAGEIRRQKADERRRARLAAVAALSGNAGPLPSTSYPVILADPPWNYDNECASHGAAADHYPCMPTDEIAAMKIPATPSAILFLWAVSPMLREALRIMAAWGFDYRASVVWDKCRAGMGNWVRIQHELLLIGVRGDMPCPATNERPPSVIRAPRGEHSRKPAESYELIEAMYPTLPKLELFARQARPGWSAWGAEAGKFEAA